MAWKQCKIAANAAIEKLVAEKKKAEPKKKYSVRKACEELAKESGIPSETLRDWHKNRNKNQGQEEPLKRDSKSNKGNKDVGEKSPSKPKSKKKAKKSSKIQPKDFKAMHKQLEEMSKMVATTEKSTISEDDLKTIRLVADEAESLQEACEALLEIDEEDS